MHKNNYTAKTLNGNWHENRYTEEYDQLNDATSNTYLQNPCTLEYLSLSIHILTCKYDFSLQQIRTHFPRCWKREKLRKSKY